MPLDDVYIHFQYARQLAAGQPYVYNPGLPPSSGATSFLYPFVLVPGYLLGFQGLKLALWAMLIGMVALAGAMLFVYRLGRAYGLPLRLAVVLAAVFGVSGPVSWHFMSGMETGLVILFTLGALDSIIASEDNLRYIPFSLFWLILLALIRPETGVLVIVSCGILVFWWRSAGYRRYRVWLLIPMLMVGVQPAVNLLLTGSPVASGNTAKSVFGMVPFSLSDAATRTAENFIRIWVEFATGISPREGLYAAPFLLLLALVGLILLFRLHRWRWIALMLVGWLIAGSLAISTLDTAFWHFKRYQMPLAALLYVIAGWGIVALLGRSPRSVSNPITSPRSTNKIGQLAAYGVVVSLVGFAIWTAPTFLDHFRLNVGYVYAQPLRMADWLKTNTPEDVLVAVHDTGLLRYAGERTTLDMVGLTTPGAAESWRSGPGAIAEYLIRARPDYIASYGAGHGFGLGMIAQTSLYGSPLALFTVELDPNFNVALAADVQGVYQPDWANADSATELRQISATRYLDSIDPLDVVNVADLASEKIHDYHWTDVSGQVGFPTEVFEFEALDCASSCRLVDGGRRIDGEEAFTVSTPSGHGLLLVTRLHPLSAGTFDVYVNDTLIGTRVVPQMPGVWLEVPTLIPATLVTSTTRIRVVPQIPDGVYSPFYHWIFAAEHLGEVVVDAPLTTFHDESIQLIDARIVSVDGENLVVNLTWGTNGGAEGDYKVFVHLYADPDESPIAQTDSYPGHGTLPPGNWIPGILHDRIVVDLNHVPPGTYQWAVGLYNPQTMERLVPIGGDALARFFVGEVSVKP